MGWTSKVVGAVAGCAGGFSVRRFLSRKPPGESEHAHKEIAASPVQIVLDIMVMVPRVTRSAVMLSAPCFLPGSAHCAQADPPFTQCNFWSNAAERQGYRAGQPRIRAIADQRRIHDKRPPARSRQVFAHDEDR